MGRMRNAHGDARRALEMPRKYGFHYYVIINTERTQGEHESRPRIQGSGIPVVSEGGRRGAVETFISGVSALHTWVPCEWSSTGVLYTSTPGAGQSGTS